MEVGTAHNSPREMEWLLKRLLALLVSASWCRASAYIVIIQRRCLPGKCERNYGIESTCTTQRIVRLLIASTYGQGPHHDRSAREGRREE
ncbi:hypothetical protein IW261DRAFT_1485514 [Armillaria novae-zelandiae]|uniref:Uncharacterized protein n=1 Tax=Armillaria novae-zelandiae TaxID=153914 RepID=A0AA39P4W0_9AGAR|nr:hypothetical protein IW261DRAFT_1485514 [Armillaria novae-zelandiae]